MANLKASRRNKGILCPKCKSSEHRVVNTFHRNGATVRVRCCRCRRRFMTGEKVESNSC